MFVKKLVEKASIKKVTPYPLLSSLSFISCSSFFSSTIASFLSSSKFFRYCFKLKHPSFLSANISYVFFTQSFEPSLIIINFLSNLDFLSFAFVLRYSVYIIFRILKHKFVDTMVVLSTIFYTPWILLLNFVFILTLRRILIHSSKIKKNGGYRMSIWYSKTGFLKYFT
ncbi:hypothetical protein V8G54_000903 [Vigna mungo]|uniref:Uncharacterized protein n=1 Tax=Vigna mungo TaxID=3915 RepID=A0AAQ3S7P6_VIGMU